MSKEKYQTTSTAVSSGTARRGREHYSHVKADARKERRREEAEDRQAKYDSLSASAKIALVKSRRGESKRELARLTQLEAKAVVKPFVQVPVTIIAAPKAADPVLEKKKRTKKQVVTEAKAKRPSKS
jgi:hypothetical protein